MSEDSSTSCSMQQQCEAVEPQEKSMDAIMYTEESGQMRLDDAVESFGLSVAVVFLVIEGTYNAKEREALAKGDVFIACLKKAASFLKLKSGSTCVTVPVVTQTEFALTPLSEEDNEADAAIRSWEGVYHSVTEFFEAQRDQCTPMPAALKVLNCAVDHSKKKVPPMTLLFNIRPVSQRVRLQKRSGIEGVDSSGAVHRFLEGEDPLYFSTKLFDVKCSPMRFLKALHLPQTAVVYLHPDMVQEEDEGVRSLQNLSTTTITEVSHDHHLVVRKLSEDGNQLGSTFTVPLSADLKVVAIKLKDTALLDSISDQRCIVRATSSPSIGPMASLADMYVNPYSDDHCEATRGDIQAGRKIEATKDDNCARPLPPTPEEKLAATSLDREGLYEVPGKLRDCMGQTTDSTPTAIAELTEVEENTGADLTMSSIPETTIPESNADTSTDDNGYTRVGTASVPAQEGGYGISHIAAQQVRPERSGDSHASEQGLPLPNKAVQRSLVRHNSAPPHRSPSSSQRRRNTVCKDSGLQRFSLAQHSLGVDANPTELELFHHVACNLGDDWKHFAIYLGFESKQIQQADKEKSSKDKAYDILVAWLKGTGNEPKTWATILAALKSTELTDLAHKIQRDIEQGALYRGSLLTGFQRFSLTQHSLGVDVSRPKEPELRFHVAAWLGLDWRKVCTYLGLQHYQLQQADEAHTKLEEKAMEALVMWLQGQGDSEAPRSWSTLLQALHRAGRNDMASDLERSIENKTLGVMLPVSAPQAPKKLTTHSTVTTVPSPASTDTAAAYGSVLQHSAGLVFPKEPDMDIVKASEAVLHDLCWIPFGIQIQSAGPEGRRLPLAGPMGKGGKEIYLEVPPGAVGPSVTLEVHSAVIPNGPFALPEGYQFGSHVVYIYFDGRHVTSALHLWLPHWYGGEDQVQDGLSFAMSPHTLKEGESVYHFELIEGGRFLNHCGELEIDGHCSLFAEVFKKGATFRYQAITLQKEEGTKTTCDVAVMYATPLWCEILIKYRKEKSGWIVSNPSCPFTLKEGRIRGLLKEKHGNGWHAVISGSHVLEPRHLEYDYHGITSPKLLEMAVNNRGYPPAITCVVSYQEELRITGNPVWVELDLLGADHELSFQCTAYEQADRNAAAAAPQSPQASSTDVMTDCNLSVPNEREPVDEVLCHFRKRFIKEVDAQCIVSDLKHKGIISDAVLIAVNREAGTTRQNNILYDHLERTSTGDSLTTVCDAMISVSGHPKMNQLGQHMKNMLQGKWVSTMSCLLTHISVALCRNEPELRFHVAAKLGLDWRKVCTYLELQHYQLDQAKETHTHLLEEKAMEALVMWLQRQGDSDAPRSWNTLLQALRRAGHSDMASHVEKCIEMGHFSCHRTYKQTPI